jgi:hypothetical protein
MQCQILITLEDDGRVNVNGPLENKLLCYGLLEVAKETIVIFQQQMAKKVQPATEVELKFLKKEI